MADSVHRPLMLSALTMASKHGDAPLILITADLGWWRSMNFFSRFQKRLMDELSMDASRLIFALSHTHSAAPLMKPDPSLPGNEKLGPWSERVFQAAVSAARRALKDASEAIIDWHTGRCSLASLRDFPDPNPKADRLLCGFNPSGNADDTLMVGRIADPSGKLRATLVNYACHPTTLAWENTSISPDYIGAMRDTMEAATGATAFFLQGMSGDLAPRHQYVGDVEVADRHGRQLGFAALAVLNDMELPGKQLCFDQVVESGAPLAIWRPQPHSISTEVRASQTVVDLKLKNWPSAEILERQRLASDGRFEEERLRRKRDIRRSLGDGDSFPLAVHAWRVGDAIMIGSPGEAYSRLQHSLRRRFPNLSLICMNIINGWVGYLPPTELYDVDVYPVWQTPFDRGCLEQVNETMIRCIDALQN
ncbi:alkaline ceramidase [Verrucomicrobia bacterium]|nr:alkaline ceramidase [Verrucomicrobiota bacterium]